MTAIRFLLLAVIGFGLGAGLAYFQQSQETPPAVVAEQAAPATETAAVPAAETALDATAPAEQPAVAGSSVGGAFTLTDYNGVEVTEKSWPGKMKLVFFGFTSCPDICPAALDKITTALNTLGADAEKIQPLLITVDPARDTAEMLKTYLGRYHSSILGLTGTEEQLKASQDAYKVFASKGEEHEGHYNVDHSGYVYLMSEDDKMLDIFGSSDTADTMVEKIKARLAETTTAVPAETPVETAPAAEATPATDEAATAPATEETPAVSSDTPAEDAAPATETPVTETAPAPAPAPAETTTEETAPPETPTEAPVTDTPAAETPAEGQQ